MGQVNVRNHLKHYIFKRKAQPYNKTVYLKTSDLSCVMYVVDETKGTIHDKDFILTL